MAGAYHREVQDRELMASGALRASDITKVRTAPRHLGAFSNAPDPHSGLAQMAPFAQASTSSWSKLQKFISAKSWDCPWHADAFIAPLYLAVSCPGLGPTCPLSFLLSYTAPLHSSLLWPSQKSSWPTKVLPALTFPFSPALLCSRRTWPCWKPDSWQRRSTDTASCLPRRCKPTGCGSRRQAKSTQER